MKFLLPPALLAILLLLVSSIQGKKVNPSAVPGSPLSGYSPAWNDAKYLKCNTAASTRWLTRDEKELIYILNMARMNPRLFGNTVVKQYPDKSRHNNLRNSQYYTSLMDTLQGLKPMKLLYPDSLCYASAFCHAMQTGKEGTVTHERTTSECISKIYFNGECCDYGHDNALDVLLSLLIDEGVPSLGHRQICLSSYKKLGVSIQPHIYYGHTAVLDFKY
jgi:hypothetical protein